MVELLALLATDPDAKDGDGLRAIDYARKAKKPRNAAAIKKVRLRRKKEEEGSGAVTSGTSGTATPATGRGADKLVSRSDAKREKTGSYRPGILAENIPSREAFSTVFGQPMRMLDFRARPFRSG